MGRNKQREREPEPVVQPVAEIVPVAIDEDAKRKAERTPDTVAKCRQCPICWEGRRGKGTAYTTSGRTRYYRCDQCAYTWKFTVPTTEEIRPEHG